MTRLLLLALSLMLAAPLASAQVYVAALNGSNAVPSNGTGATGVAVLTLLDDGATVVITGRFDSIAADYVSSGIFIGEPGETGTLAFDLDALGFVIVDSDNRGARFNGSTTMTPAQVRELRFEGMYIDVDTQDEGKDIRGQYSPNVGTSLVISGIVDGESDSSAPSDLDELRAIELWAREDIPDLSVYALGVTSDGGGTDGEEYTLSGSASAGDYIYIACSADGGEATFTSFFGFAPTLVEADATCDGNGDEAYELLFEATGNFSGTNSQGSGARGRAATVDVFGDIDTDGTGEVWEYRDGWAYRAFGKAGSPVFDPTDWIYSGVNALDGETTNAGAATPFPTATFLPGTVTAEGEGFRLIGVPGGGLTVTDLAILNLVQGLPAGSDPVLFPAQYRGGADVLFTSYDGSYGTPDDTGVALEPGRGLFWYLFDQDLDPMTEPNGRSISREMNGFYFPIIGNAAISSVDRTFSNSSDGFYMLANPFQEAFNLSGISSSVGVIASDFFAWDPTLNGGAGDYVTVSAGTDAIQPWQGVFGEITTDGTPSPAGTAVAGDPTVTYDASAIAPDETGAASSPFYGRQAARQEIAFTLDGTLDSGIRVGDHAASIRVVPGATLGWDRFDLSELAPPYGDQARLAIAGDLRPQAVFSISEDIGSGLTLPVALTATEAGTFTISWSAAALPAGWSATLTDTQTGAESSLMESGSLAFSAPAGDWVTRFQVAFSTSGTDAEGAADQPFVVGDAFPNPTRGTATVTVRVAPAHAVRADVFDSLGRRVAVAFQGTLAADTEHSLSIGAGLAAGVYVVRIEGQDFVTSRRLVVTR